MKQLTITRDVYDLVPLASKDETRYNIVGIHCEEKVAVATDGQMLGLQRLPEFCSDHAGRILRIQPSKVRKGLAYIPEKFSDTNGGPNTVSQTGAIAEEIDGEYPDWKQVLPKEAPTFSYSLNASYLTALCKFVTANEKGLEAAIRLDFYGPNNAVTIRGNRDDRAALLMPMRTDVPSSYVLINNLAK